MTLYDETLFEASLAKRFGKGTLKDLTAEPAKGAPGTFYATPAESLNLALSIGGIAKGAIVEIFGPESSGKTTLALEILTVIQKESGIPVGYIDAEHAFNKEYAQAIGLDCSGKMLKFNQEMQTEQALNIIQMMVQSGLSAVLLDSQPAIRPKREMDGEEVSESIVAGNSKLLRSALPKLRALADQTGCVIIIINQISSKITTYGDPETTSGGKAIPFYADARIRTSVTTPPDYLIRDGIARGNRVKAKIVKLKWGPPLRTAEYDLIFGVGIDKLGSLVEAALTKGIFVKAASWVKFKGESIGQGTNGAKAWLEATPGAIETIRTLLWE